ncbi:FHF complex subunit HOOK interacting protein 2A-like isoform X1 [Haliotis rufescens]|uniref:FHF complex subunit HOOK interacting protein 2A-like isoform X1 n=1 Tax=Haliotis rufescens TaxID=6454 RepID=UPI00201F6106|nr:FHF complex subunit HOOK interacting protein 2A-like isoform X1 [Haliotis rufescens]
MQKKMFTKFTTLIQHAVDSFAPNLSLQEEFIHHWKAVTSYFVDNKGERGHVEQTQIPGHLDQMMRILYEEEGLSLESGTTGPCLEYVLQHKLMETLYTLGRTDHPPGMKQIILSFFTKMLSRIKHPLLPHINVHRAVQRLVKTCGEVRAAPTEKEEIEFLCTVCAKIKTDPYLVNFFIEAPGKSQDKGRPSLPLMVSSQPTATNNLEFCLVDALISLMSSPDARISVKACEGLMLCVSLPEESAAKCIVADTKFCGHLTERLCQLYEDLPTVISPADIDSVDAKWGLDVFTEREDHQSFIGKRTLISFLSWLDYCDQLISIANPLVACALSTSIHVELLKGKMQPLILQTCETGAIMATCYLTRCLKTVCSQPLLTEFTHFILGNESEPEKPSESVHKMRRTLIERCNHISEEVCLSTMKLFDMLLQKEDAHIFQNLFLRNLLGRCYMKPQASSNQSQDGSGSTETQDASVPTESKDGSGPTGSQDGSGPTGTQDGSTETPAADEEDGGMDAASSHVKDADSCKEEQDEENKERTAPDSQRKGDSHDKAAVESLPTPKDSAYVRPEVHKVVNSFLTMLPEEAKSSYQTADSGYDMYLRDATRQFSCVEHGSKSWGWPVKPVRMEQYKMDVFYEGDFLHMLLTRLSKLLKQTYTINLVLTSVIARVALVPHPNLHEFLLDPFLPANNSVPTLTSVLKKVAGEIQVYLKTEPHFSDKLVVARKQLLGVMDTMHSVRSSLVKSDSIGFDDQSQLEAIIVIEEFCKELSAIAFVKHHAAVTRT